MNAGPVHADPTRPDLTAAGQILVTSSFKDYCIVKLLLQQCSSNIAFTAANTGMNIPRISLSQCCWRFILAAYFIAGSKYRYHRLACYNISIRNTDVSCQCVSQSFVVLIL
jgi:hypothetical protein